MPFPWRNAPPHPRDRIRSSQGFLRPERCSSLTEGGWEARTDLSLPPYCPLVTVSEEKQMLIGTQTIHNTQTDALGLWARSVSCLPREVLGKPRPVQVDSPAEDVTRSPGSPGQ